jgi:preprotein translocase SecE subunit
MRHQRYVLLLFVLAAIVAGVVVQSAMVSGFAQFAVPDWRVLGMVNITTAVSLAVGALTFAILIRSRQAVVYIDEVVDELFKVTWPSREETIRASTTVVYVTVFLSATLAIYDLLWKNLADLVLYSG